MKLFNFEKWTKKEEIVPKNLQDAIVFLYNNSSEHERFYFSQEPADHPGSRYHFSCGRVMRNGWGLWEKEKPLTQWFRNHGIWHADDMSAIIYKAYWCFLNSAPFAIQEEAKQYETFWKKSGLGFDGKEISYVN